MDNAEGFELVPSDAEIRMKAWGRTIKELYLNAMRGMASFMKPGVFAAGAKNKKERQAIRVEAVDINTLLVEFLSQVTALSDIHNTVYTNLAVKTLGDNFLEGEISGVEADESDREIKAVSYHEVDIKRNPASGLYETALVFDI